MVVGTAEVAWEEEALAAADSEATAVDTAGL